MHLHGERKESLQQGCVNPEQAEANIQIDRFLLRINGRKPTDKHLIDSRNRGTPLNKIQRRASRKPIDNRSSLQMIMYFLHKILYIIIKKRNQTTALLVITFWIIIYFLASRTSTEEKDSERI
jgi:hypothetical protein